MRSDDTIAPGQRTCLKQNFSFGNGRQPVVDLLWGGGLSLCCVSLCCETIGVCGCSGRAAGELRTGSDDKDKSGLSVIPGIFAPPV